MTRSCSSMSRPSSPKSKTCTNGSQPIRVPHEGGIIKRQLVSPVKTSFKAMAKCTSKSDCLAQLKNLLPNARNQEATSELALVEESIAYIAYLERILNSSYENDDDTQVRDAAAMLKSMKF